MEAESQETLRAMEGAQRVRQRLERGPGVAVRGRPYPTGVAARSASLWQVPGGGGGSRGEGCVHLGIPEPLSVLHSPPPVARREEEGPPAPQGSRLPHLTGAGRGWQEARIGRV